MGPAGDETKGFSADTEVGIEPTTSPHHISPSKELLAPKHHYFDFIKTLLSKVFPLKARHTDCGILISLSRC